MFKIAYMKRRDLRESGIVHVIAELIASGACISIDANDRKTKRHVARLARVLRCGFGAPVDRVSREPLVLSPRRA